MRFGGRNFVTSETARLLMNAPVCVLAGFAGGVIAEAVRRSLFEPGSDLTKALANVTSVLTYHGEVFSNPSAASADGKKDAAHSFKDCAGKIIAAVNSIRGYRYLSAFPRIATIQELDRICSLLLRIADGIHSNNPKRNCDDANELERALNRLPRRHTPPTDPPDVRCDEIQAAHSEK